ncbi:MAG: DUF4266 domain-containing protein [Polaribacter sp.]|uniref:DUF4266 domain-containing protein n=1 Tax=Polaribacter sp. TaxID=1920175 RepID=UPI00321C2F32
MIKKGIVLIGLVFFASSCVVVKDYEKIKINDPDMALAQKKVDRYETIAQVYREGAAGANGGKSGGGCGCN